ncbi:hypothetical protein EIP86_004571 [Pleurotus ostreatoroseus]|nr:hypothetical protein EIP86_004571 [Pleurotus ostreatoroseus]
MSTYVADVPSQRIQTPISPDDSRPYVTLTFAQSIDAKIAGKGGKQLALSGKESLVMTHWMRTMHDAIMVGIGTALNDDPQLNKTQQWAERKTALETAGATVVEVAGQDGRVSIGDLLLTFRKLGIRSLMVEGGATVIQSFLDGASRDPKSSFIDSVIVTIAPTFVGAGAVGYDANITDPTPLLDIYT